MKIVSQDTSYEVGEYTVNVLDTDKKPFISVFKANNLITTYEGWTEAADLATEVLSLHEELTDDCDECNALQDNHVTEFCNKHI